ncbi:MAG: hypothetical protein ABIA04_00290 [Pseudomonadota bacterium]
MGKEQNYSILFIFSLIISFQFILSSFLYPVADVPPRDKLKMIYVAYLKNGKIYKTLYFKDRLKKAPWINVDGQLIGLFIFSELSESPKFSFHDNKESVYMEKTDDSAEKANLVFIRNNAEGDHESYVAITCAGGCTTVFQALNLAIKPTTYDEVFFKKYLDVPGNEADEEFDYLKAPQNLSGVYSIGALPFLDSDMYLQGLRFANDLMDPIFPSMHHNKMIIEFEDGQEKFFVNINYKKADLLRLVENNGFPIIKVFGIGKLENLRAVYGFNKKTDAIIEGIQEVNGFIGRPTISKVYLVDVGNSYINRKPYENDLYISRQALQALDVSALKFRTKLMALAVSEIQDFQYSDTFKKMWSEENDLLQFLTGNEYTGYFMSPYLYYNEYFLCHITDDNLKLEDIYLASFYLSMLNFEVFEKRIISEQIPYDYAQNSAEEDICGPDKSPGLVFEKLSDETRINTLEKYIKLALGFKSFYEGNGNRMQELLWNEVIVKLNNIMAKINS